MPSGNMNPPTSFRELFEVDEYNFVHVYAEEPDESVEYCEVSVFKELLNKLGATNFIFKENGSEAWLLWNSQERYIGLEETPKHGVFQISSSIPDLP